MCIFKKLRQQLIFFFLKLTTFRFTLDYKTKSLCLNSVYDDGRLIFKSNEKESISSCLIMNLNNGFLFI